MWKSLAVIVLFATLIWGQFFECHDDPAYDPDEGPVSDLQFTWLGALQYIHVKNATPHYFRVPRVVLVSRQFVMCTAEDAALVPDGYALGNVVFADYERDEVECNATSHDVASLKVPCEPGILIVPVADVLLHPEYKHFGAKTSIALLKLMTPVKSKYVVPVCLPFKDFLVEKRGRNIKEKIFHVDFASDVPRDFIEEEKELSRYSLLPRELCYLYDKPDIHVKEQKVQAAVLTESSTSNLNGTQINKDRIACTTGCGFRSGAPSMVHEHTGHWSIVAISQGGCPCPDPLRARRPPAPPRHIVLHPYVPWITSAITGVAYGTFAKDDPFGYSMPRASLRDIQAYVWVGHWYMGGLRCFDRGDAAADLYRFYHEIFQVQPTNVTYMNYNLEISSPDYTIITCVKVGMPFQLARPIVKDLDSTEVRVIIPLVYFSHKYSFQIEAWGFNQTEEELSDTSSVTSYSEE